MGKLLKRHIHGDDGTWKEDKSVRTFMRSVYHATHGAGLPRPLGDSTHLCCGTDTEHSINSSGELIHLELNLLKPIPLGAAQAMGHSGLCVVSGQFGFGCKFRFGGEQNLWHGTVWIIFDCILDCKIGVRSENFVHGHLTCYDNFRALLKPGRCYFCRIYLPVGKVGGVQGVP